jgi:hypothetical protein
MHRFFVVVHRVVPVVNDVFLLTMMNRVMSLGHRHRRQRKQNDHE